MQRKVFVTRIIPDEGIELLRRHYEVDIFQKDEPITKKELISRAKGCEGLLCLLTDKIDEEVMETTGIKAIANYAVGYDNIDIKAASKRKIPVSNTPGVLTDATADITWALMLGVARRVVESDKYVRDGKFTGWAPKLLLGGDFVKKTLGIIGMGRIGQAVAKRAQGFGMEILYYSRSPKPDLESEYKMKFASLERLIKASDYITLHCPYNKETHHIIGKKQIELMKPTVYLINTARGKVIDEQVVIKALKNKRIAGAAFDVYYNEPKVNPELVKLSNVILLPHIGSASYNTRSTMATMAAKNLIQALKGEKPTNIVNPSIYQ